MVKANVTKTTGQVQGTEMVKAQTTVDKRIVVLTAGWVHIGSYHAATTATPAHLTDASNIRTWGTTSGLGEIACKGPTKDTVLDFLGIVILDNPQAVLFTLKCEV